MFKKKQGRKFSRTKDQRRIFLRSIMEALILNGKIKTTEARAKEVRGKVERLVSRSKKGDLATLRYVNKHVGEEASKKLIKEVGPKYAERKGGYTRITKIGQRKSDGSQMTIIELI